jgi:hypothetical protein
VWSVLVSGIHTKLLATVCIASTIVAVDGPLLQRATQVRPTNISVNLLATITPEVPAGLTGQYWSIQPNGTFVLYSAKSFLDFMHTTYGGPTGFRIPQFVSGCPSTCYLTIHGPALALDFCNSTDTPRNWAEPVTPQNVSSIPSPLMAAIGPANSLNFPIYGVSAFSTEANPPVGSILASDSLHILVGYAEAAFSTVPNSCSGIYHFKDCRYKPAIAKYHLAVINNIVALTAPANQVKIIALANDTSINNNTGIAGRQTYVNSTMAGITSLLDSLVGTYFYWGVQGESIVELDDSSLSFKYANLSNVYSSQNCYNFSDPTESVLETANQIMFQTGIYTAQALSEGDLRGTLDEGLSGNQTVRGALLGNVFYTSYWYFLAASVVEITCILLVLPLYWGYWRLGRPISFSPLEIAKVCSQRLKSM